MNQDRVTAANARITRLSKLFGKRLRENPRDARSVSHGFLTRGGFVRTPSLGRAFLLPLGLKILRRIETIARAAMEMAEGQEIQTTYLEVPESCPSGGLIDTAAVEFASYRELPAVIFRLCQSFPSRHEDKSFFAAMARLSLFEATVLYLPIQGREGVTSGNRLGASPLDDPEAFARDTVVSILEACGLNDSAVMAKTHDGTEFVFPHPSGSRSTVLCGSCGSRTSAEAVSPDFTGASRELHPLVKVHTPGCKTIAEVAGFLGIPETSTAKAVFFKAESRAKSDPDQLIFALVRGDREVSEAKLRRTLGRGGLRPATDADISAAGAVPGYASPIGVAGRDIKIIVDPSVAVAGNLVTGANETDFHFTGFDFRRDLGGRTDVEVADIVETVDGDQCGECGGRLFLEKGFTLAETRASGRDGVVAEVLGPDGKPIPVAALTLFVVTGSLITAAVEASHDEFGPVWSRSITPFDVHVCVLNPNRSETLESAMAISKELAGAGFEVLLDDRGESPGVQFTDADLMGVPARLVFSPKNIERKVVELKRRGSPEKREIPLGSIAEEISGLKYIVD